MGYTNIQGKRKWSEVLGSPGSRGERKLASLKSGPPGRRQASFPADPDRGRPDLNIEVGIRHESTSGMML
jgi:hypothetical protein